LPYKLDTICHDLRVTAGDLEGVMRDMSGHLEYLKHSIHQQDAADVQGQVKGLGSSINRLRRVADSIVIDPDANQA